MKILLYLAAFSGFVLGIGIVVVAQDSQPCKLGEAAKVCDDLCRGEQGKLRGCCIPSNKTSDSSTTTTGQCLCCSKKIYSRCEQKDVEMEECPDECRIYRGPSCKLVKAQRRDQQGRVSTCVDCW